MANCERTRWYIIILFFAIPWDFIIHIYPIHRWIFCTKFLVIIKIHQNGWIFHGYVSHNQMVYTYSSKSHHIPLVVHPSQHHHSLPPPSAVHLAAAGLRRSWTTCGKNAGNQRWNARVLYGFYMVLYGFNYMVLYGSYMVLYGFNCMVLYGSYMVLYGFSPKSFRHVHSYGGWWRNPAPPWMVKTL